MRVFLTGGTGLLGSHLAQELRREGVEVVALVRPTSDTAALEAFGCGLVEGDVRDPEASLVPKMAGCTHVVHGAALVYAGGSWPAVRAVNVDGTANVLGAAAQSGVRHVLHISSVAVYGTVDGTVDETSPVNGPIPADDHYARSKREAEVVARRIERERGVPVTIARPAAVYGERDRLMVPAVADIVRLPLVPVFGPGTNTLPVVYAGNVAVALRLMLEAERAGPEATYDLGLDHPLTQLELFRELSSGLGRDLRSVRLPAPLVRGGVGILSALGVGAPGAKHLPLDRVARLALGENPYPSRRVREVLGWDPPHVHPEALRRSGRWYASLP